MTKNEIISGLIRINKIIDIDNAQIIVIGKVADRLWFSNDSK